MPAEMKKGLLLSVLYSLVAAWSVSGQKKEAAKVKEPALTFELGIADSFPVLDAPVALDLLAESISGRSPRPRGGYEALRQFLEEHLMAGTDTTGKKYPLPLWNIRFRVSETGKVDTGYVFVKTWTSLHTEVIRLLKQTQWDPATDQTGKPISNEIELWVRPRVTRKVLKQHSL
jgi:hypothetical protein